MAVPKTSIHEYATAVFCQNDIGFPGEALDVEAVPVSESEQFLAQPDFRLGVVRPDMRHTVVTLLRGQGVGPNKHSQKSFLRRLIHYPSILLIWRNVPYILSWWY